MRPTLRTYLLIFLIALALGLGGLAFGAWQQWQLAARREVDPELLFSRRDLVTSAAGITCFALYLVWVSFFLMQLRPAVAARLGAALGVTIREGRRSDWRVVERGQPLAGCLVALADITLLILGAIGPVAAIIVALLLAGVR